jgi:hypothetical protein
MAPQDADNRGELAGILLVLVIATIVGAVLVGLWLGLVAALIVTIGFALTTITVLFVLASRRSGRPPVADAPRVEPLHDGRFRILVVADAWGASPDLIEKLRSHAGGRPASAFVMAPAVGSRLGILGEDQKDYDAASGRLAEAVKGLEGAGLDAQGEIGSSDPLQACDDGLRQFAADEIVFVTHPDKNTKWLEEGLIEQAKARYQQPVEHFVV